MAWIVKPKRSNVPSAVPTTSNLADGEFAVNTADKKIYMRVGSSVVEIANADSGGTVGFEIDGGSASTSYSGVPVFDFGSAS